MIPFEPPALNHPLEPERPESEPLPEPQELTRETSVPDLER